MGKMLALSPSLLNQTIRRSVEAVPWNECPATQSGSMRGRPAPECAHLVDFGLPHGAGIAIYQACLWLASRGAPMSENNLSRRLNAQ